MFRLAYFWFKANPFAFPVEKCTPAWKKYANAVALLANIKYVKTRASYHVSWAMLGCEYISFHLESNFSSKGESTPSLYILSPVDTTKSHLFNRQNSPIAAATCKKRQKQNVFKMWTSGDCHLFLVASSGAPVPDGNKVDFFFTRKLNLININMRFCGTFCSTTFFWCFLFQNLQGEFFHWYPQFQYQKENPQSSQSRPFLVTGFAWSSALIGWLAVFFLVLKWGGTSEKNTL